MYMPPVPGWEHWAPVARPWWAFWRKERYVRCNCSFGIFTMDGSGWEPVTKDE